MKIAEVKITEWESPKIFKIRYNDNIKKGDKVIVRSEAGEDLGVVSFFKEIEETKENEISNVVLRKVNKDDLSKIESNEKDKEEFFAFCQQTIQNLGLKMKLVDVYFSFDAQRIIFVFTAEGRIDFRELVKRLSREFHKSIRMHQIGIRDEAKLAGKLGMCGRPLCCKGFLKELVSVNSEAAELQQIAHRGADRISGICGRLMCCLNYEIEGYRELAEKLPKKGSIVKYTGRKYEIIDVCVLKQTVKLKMKKEEQGFIEVEASKLG